MYIECDAENYHDSNIVGMAISDGNNSVVSEYVPLGEILPYPADDEIWYTNGSTTQPLTPNQYRLPSVQSHVFDI